MSTFVTVNTYSHTVTYVAAKMLLSVKEVVRQIGLDPGQLTDDWFVLERGISTWLGTRHLEGVTLEVYDSATDKLVTRWDFTVVYGYAGDGSLWVDTDAISYHIAKAGTVPWRCKYRIVVSTSAGRPSVPGWSDTSFRSTEGFSRYGVGATIGGNGIASQLAYWRRP